jgi:hypothetical protein
MPRPPASERLRKLRSPTPPAQPTHLDWLRNALPGTLETLGRCRADLLDPARIEEYVSLDWLEWNGGRLRATITGANICQQVRRMLPAPT